MEYFLEKDLKPKIWMAPASSFDLNTLKALKKFTEIEYISDGFAIFPFTAYGFKWILQQIWKFIKFPFGVWTISPHPNNMGNEDLKKLENTLSRYKNLFTCDIFNLNFEEKLFKVLFNKVFNFTYLKFLEVRRK